MKTRILTVICLLVLAVLLFPKAAPPVRAQTSSSGTWIQTFSSGFQEFFAYSSMQLTSDGGLIIAGDLNVGTTAWVLRLDASGNVVWENGYSGAGSSSAHSVAQTSDGGFVVAGSTQATGGSTQAWVLRLDGDGNVVWENAYRGAGSASAQSVKQTLDGGFIVAGNTGCGAWALRLDDDGVVIWENTYCQLGGSPFADSVGLTSDGGFIVAGSTNSFANAWLLRLDDDGNVIWENAYSGEGSFVNANSVEQTSDGGFVFGTEDCCSANTERAVVVQVDGDGDIVWAHDFSTPGGCNSAVSVEQTSDNGYIVGFGCDNSVIRLDDDGNIVWQFTYGGFAEIDSVHQTPDGGFVLAGCCSVSSGSFVAKIDSDGQVGSSCASITASTLQQSDASYTVTPTSSTVTDISSLDNVTPTSSTVTDTSATDTVALLCQDDD